MNKQNKNRLVETRNKLVMARGEGGGGSGGKMKGNTVNSSVITLHCDRWMLGLVWQEHHKIYKCRITVLYM